MLKEWNVKENILGKSPYILICMHIHCVGADH